MKLWQHIRGEEVKQAVVHRAQGVQVVFHGASVRSPDQVRGSERSLRNSGQNKATNQNKWPW